MGRKKAGAVVPRSFAEFGKKINEVYTSLVKAGAIPEVVEPEIPKVPMDYTWAKRLGMVRKPASFISSISDDRGEELLYAGMPISEVFSEDIGVGGVLSLFNGLFLELFRGVLSGSIMLSVKESLTLTVKIALWSAFGRLDAAVRYS